jgi:hypothetical protein
MSFFAQSKYPRFAVHFSTSGQLQLFMIAFQIKNPPPDMGLGKGSLHPHRAKRNHGCAQPVPSFPPFAAKGIDSGGANIKNYQDYWEDIIHSSILPPP